VIHFVTWLWGNGFRPNGTYNHKHVDTVAYMLKKHCSLPHKVHCFTDNPEGIRRAKAHALVGDPVGFNPHSPLNCYRRIWLWSPEARKVLGATRPYDLIVSIDLDCLVLGSLDSLLLTMQQHEACLAFGRVCEFNGSLWSFKSGAHPHVWDNWDPMTTPARLVGLKQRRRWVGSDQAYFAEQLTGKAHKLKMMDGIAHFSLGRPQKGAKLVFFAGGIKPWQGRLLACAPELHAHYAKYYQAANREGHDGASS
jgi:hypothetical protein